MKPVLIDIRVARKPRTADMQDMVDRIDQRVYEETGVRRAAISLSYDDFARAIQRQMARAMGVSADMLRSR